MNGPYDYLVVLDFEATCQEGAPPVPQEVIEFPSVLISLEACAIIDSFSSFVRPIHHPRLSEFCMDLTSIRQFDVDSAPTFTEVLDAHRSWLTKHGLLGPGPERFAFVTCGEWDLATLLPEQCAASSLPVTSLPRVYRQWINVKTIFAAGMTGRRKGVDMLLMLRELGLDLVGAHHRGIDDSYNIAQIVLALAERGSMFEITSHLSLSHYPELELELVFGDRVERVVLERRSLSSLLGLAGIVFRAEIVSAHTADGAVVDGDMLCEIPAGARLSMIGARR